MYDSIGRPIPYPGGSDLLSQAMYGQKSSPIPEPRPWTPEERAYLDSLTPLQRVLYPILAILSGGAFAGGLILIAHLF